MIKPESTEETIEKFTVLLSSPQKPLPKAPSHTLQLSALIIVPGPTLPSRSITSLSPQTWSDALNTRLLAPFTTLHAFLPLIVSQKSTLLFLTPSIVPSLTVPSYAVESVAAGGLQQYISTLRKELQGQDVNIVQLKLGQFNYGVLVEYGQQQLVRSQHFPVAEATRQRLEKQGLIKDSAKGASLRELHNSVFDAIVREKGKNGTIFVGRGSRTYDLVGKWVPGSIVGWMTGNGKVELRTPPSEGAEGAIPDRTSEGSWDNVGERDSDEEAYAYSKQ